MKHRDYYDLSQISALNRSVVAIQELSKLAPVEVLYAKERFRGRVFPLLTSNSTVYAVFVANGAKGTLYRISKAKGSFVSGKAANTTKITGLSSAGVLMGNILFKWRDIEVRKMSEFDARARIAKD